MEEKKLREGIRNIRSELKKYLLKNKLKSLIIGLSGGIDSAICVALAEPVCSELGIKFIGRSLPILTNKSEEIERARDIGENFRLEFKEIVLDHAYIYLSQAIKEVKEDGGETEMEEKIREGNIKVRVRMIYLYNLAALHNGMVLSTDNWTELMLGFWTLHGDIGDYGMVQQLDKTEVYEMARIIVSDLRKRGEKYKASALEDCINATPTDGLGITNSDLDQIKADSYEEVDKILHAYIDKGDLSLRNHPIIKRHERTHFKRHNPFNIPREKIFTKL
ncbi:MAG: NAD(+) synthase [Promethearchaeota archaeon]